MVIKNFFWRLGGLLLLTLSLSSCQIFSKNASTGAKSHEVDVIEEDPEASDKKTVAPAFLEKEPPRLGIILGPGGSLSFSQIGFLQELESQKIKVHSIAGIEWGALVAGAYSLSSKAHSIEWKLLKLPYQKFTGKSFFSGKKAPSVSEFDSYLSKVFGDQTYEDAEIGFSCPYINVAKEKSLVSQKGRIKNAIRACWPSIPHFKLESVGADLGAVAALSRQLKAQGAELIIYVDVLKKNRLLKRKDRMAAPAADIGFVQAKSSIGHLSAPIVDEVVSIPLSGHHMNSYKSLRSLIRLGQIKSKKPIQKLVKKYAY